MSIDLLPPHEQDNLPRWSQYKIDQECITLNSGFTYTSTLSDLKDHNAMELDNHEPASLRRSERKRKPTQKAIESAKQSVQDIKTNRRSKIMKRAKRSKVPSKISKVVKKAARSRRISKTKSKSITGQLELINAITIVPDQQAKSRCQRPSSVKRVAAKQSATPALAATQPRSGDEMLNIPKATSATHAID